MPGDVTGYMSQAELRMRAVERLKGEVGASVSRRSPSEALSVLFDMASQPSTAGSALAVLHELQVHQVELELQAEELRRSRLELEATLGRLTQLYDHAPVAYFTVDKAGAIREVNLTGTTMLGCGRELLQGRTLLSFLEPQSVARLQGMLARLADGVPSEAGVLQLVADSGARTEVRVCAKCDPQSAFFLVAFADATVPADSSAA